MTRVLLLLACCCGCAKDTQSALIPDRCAIGTSIDADTYEAKSYQFNLYWSLRPGK